MQADENTENEKGLGKEKKYFSAYAKYSAMGFQMFAIIAVFAGVFCALYLVIRSIKNLNP